MYVLYIQHLIYFKNTLIAYTYKAKHWFGLEGSSPFKYVFNVYLDQQKSLKIAFKTDFSVNKFVFVCAGYCLVKKNGIKYVY